MATSDQIDAAHRNITILTGTGSAAALLGMSSYFMAYEYKDFDRIGVQGQDNMDREFQKRKKTALIVLVLAGLVYVTGLVCLTLGVSLYRTEREEQGTSIPVLIQQIRNTDAQPKLNEPAILSGISSAIILLGVIESARHFHKTEDFGWIGSTLYAAGWLGQAFAAAMNNKSINSLVDHRLAWTLPGAAAIVGGTYLIPWQLQNNYISGPGWPISALGYVALTIGTAYVTDPPQLES